MIDTLIRLIWWVAGFIILMAVGIAIICTLSAVGTYIARIISDALYK